MSGEEIATNESVISGVKKYTISSMVTSKYDYVLGAHGLGQCTCRLGMEL